MIKINYIISEKKWFKCCSRRFLIFHILQAQLSLQKIKIFDFRVDRVYEIPSPPLTTPVLRILIRRTIHRDYQIEDDNSLKGQPLFKVASRI